jgi:hypothetical protein
MPYRGIVPRSRIRLRCDSTLIKKSLIPLALGGFGIVMRHP